MRRETLAQLMAARREGRLLVRALDVTSGDEQLIDPAADTSPLGRAAAAAARADRSQRVTIDGRTWFLSAYHAPREIVIIGAVHIAQALASLAGPAGYRVRVIDPRAPYATAERFPGITLQREWPDEALEKQPLTAHSALIALAHDPKLDDAGIAMALRSTAFYVGALGSQRTHARRLARLEAQGFSATELARIHGPVGLAIGARSPSEIAIAILADMVQQRRAHKEAPRIAGIVLAAGASTRMGQNKLILPLRAESEHSVVAFVQLREHEWNVGGVVLQIAVECRDHVAGRGVESCLGRSALAAVPPQPHDLDARITFRCGFEFRESGVLAAVVNEDEFPRSVLQRGPHAFDHWPHILGFILQRDYDREQVHFTLTSNNSGSEPYCMKSESWRLIGWESSMSA